MTKAILLHNATLIDPKNETEFSGSVLIKNGVIADILKNKANLKIPNCEVIDCQNYILSPGLVDMWVFAGEPGFEHIETIESLIHNYNQLLSENKELKQKNKRLQKNLQKYKKIPCVPCTIIT